MKWSDLLERQKRRLNYLATTLNINDVDVESMAKRDFEDISFQSTKASLKSVAI